MDIDGIRFNILHEGDRTQPLVVLSHALMSNMHMWDRLVLALHKSGFSTLRYDHVGHGQTSEPAADRIGKYRFDDFCRHVHEMVERNTPGIAPFAFIGCSMGGVLALRYALMYPGTLTRIVSCDAPGMTSLEESKPKWKDRIAVFSNQGIEPLAKATVERWFPDPCPPSLREEALRHTMTCSLAGYVTCAEGIMNYDYTLALSQMQTEEVMILAGEKDEAIGTPDILINVASNIRGAKHVVMKDAGHLPPMYPGFEGIVIPFLRS